MDNGDGNDDDDDDDDNEMTTNDNNKVEICSKKKKKNRLENFLRKINNITVLSVYFFDKSKKKHNVICVYSVIMFYINHFCQSID